LSLDILKDVKLTAQIKLMPDRSQAEALLSTLRVANDACNFVSQAAWKVKTFRQFDLHHLCYRDVRSRFNLSAQVAVRVISKVADSYKLDRKTERKFKSTGSIAYDDRIMSWRIPKSRVSIWTTFGRIRIPFVCGDRQRNLLLSRKGETDLIYRKGTFYLSATCEADAPLKTDTTCVLGIDLGIKNIAVDSDGTIHSSGKVNSVRHRHRRLRTKLQEKGTRSAKRKLKKLSGKESRFARDVNHCISKVIVAKAKDTKRAVALEDLTGIRMRVTVPRLRRATLSSWSFSQLRSFISYKSEREGIPTVLVDPRNTSRTCPECGTIDKGNRKSQRLFSCVSCGFTGLADHIAAENIRRAAVNQPIVARVLMPKPPLTKRN
jgi:IS605 OrfB family transposase